MFRVIVNGNVENYCGYNGYETYDEAWNEYISWNGLRDASLNIVEVSEDLPLSLIGGK